MSKIYCGSGKIINGQYGDFLSLNLEVDTINDYCITAKNGKRYISLTISDRKAPDNYGNTKNVIVNTPPDKKPEVKSNQHSPDRETADLPF